jgi:isopentenyl-diphosphate delta-isomerase
MEQVVLVDESGRAAGVADKQAVHTSSTPLHLAFSCYLLDSAGRLLLTRRAPSKKTWPGVWTNSCCGHPLPGEAIEDSVVRRVRDELGMAVQDLRLVLPEFRYRAEMNGVVENELCPVFLGRAVGTPAPDTQEVAAVRWVSWDAFRQRARRRPSSLSPWCVEQSRLLARLPGAPSDWPEAPHERLPEAAVTTRASASRLP